MTRRPAAAEPSAVLPIPGHVVERRAITAGLAFVAVMVAAWAVVQLAQAAAAAVAHVADRMMPDTWPTVDARLAPFAFAAVALLWVGHRSGRRKQRRAHAIAVWKGHPR